MPNSCRDQLVSRRSVFRVLAGLCAAQCLRASDAVAQPTAPTNLQVGSGGAVGSGFPAATNTGPVPGTVFTNSTGILEVRSNNVVVNGLRHKGAISVYSNNVTVQNCEVNASGEIWGIRQMPGGSGLVVKNCHVYGIPIRGDRNASHVLVGIGDAVEMAFNNVHGCEVALSSGTGYLHDNYLHDFPRWELADDHTDGVQTYGHAGEGGLRVIHNTIVAILTAGDPYTPSNYGAGSTAIALSEGMHDLTISDNLLYGGTYTIYGPSQAGSSPANVRVTNNRFSTQYFPRCGMFGPQWGFKPSAPGFQWSGNVWHETGQPLAFNA